MPERAFLTETWDDDWFQELDRDQRYLFIYLWTNSHCNQAGVFHVTLATIAFETKIPREEIPDLMRALQPKVEWYPEENYIWVRNFIKRQSKSPKFLIAAANCLKAVKSNGLVKEVLDYNKREHSISIPYEYCIDSVGIEYRYCIDTPLPPNPSPLTPDPDPDSGSFGEKGVVKGEEGFRGNVIPPSESEIEESLSEGDREVISVWHSVRGFNLAASDAAELVAKLRTEFADVDILEESKAWAARKLSEPLKSGTRPSSQLWNWMRKAREFASERSVVPRSSKKGETLKLPPAFVVEGMEE